MADGEHDKQVHAGYDEAPEIVHDGAAEPDETSNGPSTAAQALEWARREARERGTYLVAEVRRRPWQSAAVMLSCWCFLGQLISLSSSWLEAHVVPVDGSGVDIAAHADLSHVWSCQTSVRTAQTPGRDCDIFSFGDAPLDLDGLGSATGAAAAFAIIGFILCMVGLALVILRRLDRTDLLGSFASSLGSKTSAVTFHGLAAFCDMIAFSAYAGGVNSFLGDTEAVKLLTRGITPTATWYGAGFAFAILGWLVLAATAFTVYRTPESEEFVPVPRASHVGTASAGSLGNDGAATGASGDMSTYSAPLTSDEEQPPVTATFGGAIGGDDDAAEGADAFALAADEDEAESEPAGDERDAAEEDESEATEEEGASADPVRPGSVEVSTAD